MSTCVDARPDGRAEEAVLYSLGAFREGAHERDPIYLPEVTGWYREGAVMSGWPVGRCFGTSDVAEAAWRVVYAPETLAPLPEEAARQEYYDRYGSFCENIQKRTWLRSRQEGRGEGLCAD